MTKSIFNIEPLGFPWKTKDPFLFCVHHEDFYPKGNKNKGPDPKLLNGRNIGNDFTIKDGWRMYHGKTIPGFPSHPHRGFETITINRQGIVDHADSLGGLGRFGKGDVQWMTAGKGIQHSEMFPLLQENTDNTLEIFQIWLNLPKAGKFVEPHFKMLWSEMIPHLQLKDENGQSIDIDVIAGSFNRISAPDPTPDSWASASENDVNIWSICLEHNAMINLPVAAEGAGRTIYFYKGGKIDIDGQTLEAEHLAEVDATRGNSITNKGEKACFLMLQGKPINEPVAQYGPFVMNTQAEIMQAYNDYQRTHFGGWPWKSEAPVHDVTKGRFAQYPDGKVEKPNSD